MLRLLTLPASIRRLVQDSQITLGHARALLAIGDERRMVDLAKRVVADGLTVRDVERFARELSGDERPARRRMSKTPGGTPVSRRIEDDLRRYLQTDVRITLGEGNRGQIAVSFYSADDLERILDLMLGQSREQT
jgi:ParB family chromosome partitioning protein